MGAKKMTRKEIDRALVAMFNCDVPQLPRVAMPDDLYEYARVLAAPSRRELAAAEKRKRSVDRRPRRAPPTRAPVRRAETV